MNLGERIAEQRVKMGYSQVELANHLNVTYQTVASWEAGETTPSLEIMIQISEVLSVGIDYLLKGKNTEAPESSNSVIEVEDKLHVKSVDSRNSVQDAPDTEVHFVAKPEKPKKTVTTIAIIAACIIVMITCFAVLLKNWDDTASVIKNNPQDNMNATEEPFEYADSQENDAESITSVVEPINKAGFSSDPEAMSIVSHSVLTIEVYDKDDNLISTGSGFVAFSPTTIVTCFHVIDGAYRILAVDENGIASQVTHLIKYNEYLDVAFLKFDTAADFKPLELCDTVSQKGENVVAIGSPLGISNSISVGILSAFVDLFGQQYFQFTAPISHGSSGGALLNDYGSVIGVTSASFSGGQNMNLAIPISVLKRFNEYKEDSMLDMSDFYVYQHPAEQYDDYYLGIRMLTITTNDYASISSMTEVEQLIESIYNEWAAGDATENGFIEISKKYRVNQQDGEVQAILPGELYNRIDQWCFDRIRKIGDTAIFQNANGYSFVYIAGAVERESDSKASEFLQRKAAASTVNYENLKSYFESTASQ